MLMPLLVHNRSLICILSDWLIEMILVGSRGGEMEMSPESKLQIHLFYILFYSTAIWSGWYRHLLKG